jgi:hypothetical protein
MTPWIWRGLVNIIFNFTLKNCNQRKSSFTGDQNYGIALSVINYLAQENEYIPWKAALSNLASLNRLLKHTHLYGVFKVSGLQSIILNITFNDVITGIDVITSSGVIP